MPVPKPNDDETERDFIERCMSNDTMNEEYPDNEQRLAICYTQWRRRNKEGQAMDIEHKSVQIELKAEKEGSFTAKIATLNVVDKDGDVMLPGAFPHGKAVLVSAYQHGSWRGLLPVGKASIKESEDNVLAEGEFNLSTQTGREHYESVKFSGGLQEWSYGFQVMESDDETRDGHKVRLLKKVEPYEISPVLLGSGVDTATLAIKNENTTYADQAETVLAAVDELVNRTKALDTLRRKEGRVLSTTNRSRIQKLLESLSEVATDLKELLEATEPKNNTEEIRRLHLEFIKIQNQLMEVS